MQPLRGGLGLAQGILAVVLWIVGVALCVTVILLPLGIPVVRLAAASSRLPRGLMHLP